MYMTIISRLYYRMLVCILRSEHAEHGPTPQLVQAGQGILRLLEAGGWIPGECGGRGLRAWRGARRRGRALGRVVQRRVEGVKPGGRCGGHGQGWRGEGLTLGLLDLGGRGGQRGGGGGGWLTGLLDVTPL